LKLKSAITLFALVLLSGLALAETTEAPAASERPTDAARMANKLDLTPEQAKRMREIRDNGGSMAEMRAVLTPEQQAKAEKMRANYGSGEGKKARLQGYLGLSESQQEEMTEILKAGGSGADIRAILTPEQQAKYDKMRSNRN
jgi:Spy/CpxP family protein refolding chaperone